MCNLSENIYDYYNVSQGKVTIPNMDDGEEFSLTDVSVPSSYHVQKWCLYASDIIVDEMRLFLNFVHYFLLPKWMWTRKYLTVFFCCYPSDYILRSHLYRVHPFHISIKTKNERKIPDLRLEKTLYETDHFLHNTKFLNFFFLDFSLSILDCTISSDWRSF